jgi:hypothetical protein
LHEDSYFEGCGSTCDPAASEIGRNASALIGEKSNPPEPERAPALIYAERKGVIKQKKKRRSAFNARRPDL